MAAVEIMFHREATDDRWMDDAACKGLTNLFFPAPAERPQARDRREAMARSVCASWIRTSPGSRARSSIGRGAWASLQNVRVPGSGAGRLAAGCPLELNRDDS